MHLTPAGRVVLDLRHRWSDGTTHLIFDPLELLERLAALTPRPRINLLFYYGVLGARSAWRGRIVPSGMVVSLLSGTATAGAIAPVTPGPRRNPLWAELMQRTFPPSPGSGFPPGFGETSPKRFARRRAASTS